MVSPAPNGTDARTGTRTGTRIESRIQSRTESRTESRAGTRAKSQDEGQGEGQGEGDAEGRTACYAEGQGEGGAGGRGESDAGGHARAKTGTEPCRPLETASEDATAEPSSASAGLPPPGEAPVASRTDLARLADRRLRRALASLSRAEGSAVLSFAEIIREALFRELGFSSIEHYARQALGFSDGKTRQFVRLCAALARLPALRAALDRGDLGWTKARTLLGVATPASEEHWLALASSCGRRELERRAAAARAAARARREAHMRRERAQRQGQDELELPEAGSPREDSSLEAGGCEGEPHGRGDAACRAGGGDGVDGAGGVDGADSRREPDEAARRNSSSTNRDGQSTAAAADDSPSSATPSSAQLPRPAIPEAAEEPIITSLRFSPLDRARYDALLERIRKLAGARSRLAPRQARREDLVLAGLALLAQAVESERRDGGDSASRPREPSPDTRVSLASNYQIIIYECATCGQAAVMTGGKMRPLSRATLEAARCDARILDTRTPQGPPNRSTVPPSLRLQLMARDGKCCRMPGCKSGMFLEAHHLIPKELGGTNELDNLILLCRACHDLVHAQPAAMRRLLASVRRRE